MDVYLGSNCIRNTSGIVQAYGREIIKAEIGNDGQLLLSVDVLQPDGSTLARLRKNTWIVPSPELDVDSSPKSLKLFRKKDGRTVLLASVRDRSTVAISEAVLFLGKGNLVLGIDRGNVVVGESGGVGYFTLGNNMIDGFSRAIEISETGVGIGVA